MRMRKILLSAALAACCLFGASGCSLFGGSSVGNVDEITFKDGDKIAEINIENYGTIRAKLFGDLAPNAVENFIALAEQGYYDGLKIHRVAPDQMIQGGSLYGDGTGGKAVINEQGKFAVETDPKARNFYGALGYANVNGMNTTQFYIVNCKTPIDITQYDPQKFKDAAKAIADQKAALEAENPDLPQMTAQEAHYNNLATMIEKASDKVIEKYNTEGGVPFWDGGYTVFGQVYEGWSVLEAISKVELGLDTQNQKTRPIEDIVIQSVKIIEYKTPETAEADSGSSKKGKKPKPAAADKTTEAGTAGSAESSETAVSETAGFDAKPATSEIPFGTIETGE